MQYEPPRATLALFQLAILTDIKGTISNLNILHQNQLQK